MFQNPHSQLSEGCNELLQRLTIKEKGTCEKTVEGVLQNLEITVIIGRGTTDAGALTCWGWVLVMMLPPSCNHEVLHSSIILNLSTYLVLSYATFSFTIHPHMLLSTAFTAFDASLSIKN